MAYEYHVIPAPARAGKVKGAKTGAERFAQTLAGVMNEQAKDGWEFVRSETLSAEERAGLMKTKTVMHSLLVFRREARNLEIQVAEVTPLPQVAATEAPRTRLSTQAEEGRAPSLRASTEG